MVRSGLEQRQVLLATKDCDPKIDQKSAFPSWTTCNKTEVIG